MTIHDLNDKQLDRLYFRLYDRMTRGMGYQAFGYDWPTLRINNPPLYRALLSVGKEIDRRSEERTLLAAS